ncbi:MAG TPA: rhomboid family intramembrane serine protease [Fimbriiglobus sp.]|jgi:membrane associated rhomboid family serine protease
MGLQDREYYRDDDESGFREWIGRRVTVVLVAVTIGVFLVQLFTNRDQNKSPGPVFDAFCLDAPKVQDGQVWRILTANFVCEAEYFLPLLIGLVILYWFGIRKEEMDGGRDLVAFYLLSGIFCQLGLFLLKITNVLDPAVKGFGPFGSFTAILAWFGTRYARQPVNIFVATVPAWSAVAGILALGVLLRFGGKMAGEFFAYDLLGVTFGFGYEKAGLRVGDWIASLGGGSPGRRHSQARLRVLSEDEDSDFLPFDDGPVGAGVAQAVEPKKNVDEQLEAKLDRVLEKVSRTGRESLTADEKAILQKASEVYKRRRGR